MLFKTDIPYIINLAAKLCMKVSESANANWPFAVKGPHTSRPGQGLRCKVTVPELRRYSASIQVGVVQTAVRDQMPIPRKGREGRVCVRM